MTQHDRLGDALRHRAEDIGPGQGHPLSLADVKGRARSIRRRRRIAVSGLAAAAVLAVVVPTGITLSDRVSSADGTPPVATNAPGPTRTTSATPEPAPARHVLLTTNVEARSPEPGVPYLFNGGITLTDGSQVPLPGDGYTALAELGKELVVVRGDQVEVLDHRGRMLRSAPGSGPLAVSPDGSVVAWSGPHGELMTMTEGGDPLQIGESGTGAPVSTAGVLGSRDCHEATGGGCTVFYNVEGAEPAAWYADSHGIRDRVAGLRSVKGVNPDGTVDGVVSVTDQGSCSAVLDTDGTVAWRTCDHTLGRFSPDGRYVLGHPAYQDGAGDASLAILDAHTGRVLVEYANDASTQAFVGTAVWDTDDTVLATVFEKGSWYLMRMAPDGSLASVSGGGLANGRDPYVSPLVLPARP